MKPAPQINHDIPEKREVIVPVEMAPDSFSVWRVSRERWGAKFRYHTTRLDTLFFGLVLSGVLEQVDGHGRTRLVKAGEVVICGAGSRRTHSVADGSVEVLMWVGLEGSATELARTHFPERPVSFPVPRPSSMESLFSMLLEEAERRGPESGRVCACLGNALLLQAAEAQRERPGPRSRREQQFAEIRRHVLDRLDEPLTVQSVADDVGISRVYLHRLFKEFEHESPQTWIRRHRMTLAAEMLQGGIHTVREVAFQLGWDDPYIFSRSFKKVIGVPPSEIIARRRTGQC